MTVETAYPILILPEYTVFEPVYNYDTHTASFGFTPGDKFVIFYEFKFN